MSSFTSLLVVSPLSDGRRWRLYLPFTYHVGSRYSRYVIKVPKGFTTDFASIPKFLFWLLPWWAKFSKPSIIHDRLYTTREVDRRIADAIFYEAMVIDFRRHGITGKVIAHIEYSAVRCWGWLAWRNLVKAKGGENV